jgi:hypothetical protein
MFFYCGFLATAHAPAFHDDFAPDIVLALYQLSMHSVSLVAITGDRESERLSDGSRMMNWDRVGQISARNDVDENMRVAMIVSHNDSAD